MSEDEELLARLADRLGPEDPKAMLAALQQLPSFQGDLSWLRLLFSVADKLPQAQPSARLVADLRSIPANEQPELFGHRPVERAMQLHDSRDEGQLVGLRGSAYRTRDVWTLVFSAPSADLIIDGTPIDSQRTRIVGQLLPRSQESARCQVTGTELDLPVASDEDGRFVIDEVAAGEFTYQIRSTDVSVECTVEVRPS